jgi:long-chain fatty acid transport protein
VRRVHTWLLVACGLLAVAKPAALYASGLELPAPGTTRSGAARIDAAGVHYNPAAIGLLPSARVLMSGGLLFGRVAYTRERLARYQYSDSLDFSLPLDEADVDTSRTGRAQTVEANPLSPIGDLFVAAPMGSSRIALGAGVYVPYGAILDLPDDGAQRWAVQDVAILNVAITPTLAFRPIDGLSLGVNLPVYVGLAELSRIQDFAELGDVGEALARPPINQPNNFGPDAPPGVRELDVMARQTVLSRAFGAAVTVGAGVAWQPTDALTLGVSYTHKARMTYVGDMQIDMDDDFFTQDLADQGLEFEKLVEGRGTLSFVLPWALRVGGVVELGARHELMVSTSVVGWSTVDAFDVRADAAGLEQPELGLPSTVSLLVPRNWRNTFDVEVVHTVRPDPIDLWYGLGLHSPASPDRWMDLAAIDGWRITAVGGLSRELREGVSLVLDLEMQAMAKRTITTSRNDIGNGEYSLLLVKGGAHLDIAF